MSAPRLLALDQGTTNSKAALFDSAGNIVARASRPLETHSPQPGWIEQDAKAIWRSILDAASDLPLGLDRLEGIGISNQRETVVLWDRKTGEPLYPAIVWQCRRSESICQALAREGLAEKLRRKTGLALDPLFSASKIRWLLERIPGLRSRARRGEVCAGTVDSWLIWNFTGGAVHACDRSNAARTQLMDLHTLDWDPELLDIFGVPAAILPRILDSDAIFGKTAASGPIPAGIPIACAIGDSPAALAGQGILAPGAVKATYGTGSSLMTLCQREPLDAYPLNATVAWSRGGCASYAFEGNITMAGAALEWCARFLGRAPDGAEFAALAAEVPDSGGVTFVPGMCGLGAPYWESLARGAVLGLERGSHAGHLARAALNSIAFQVADVFFAMNEKAERPLKELRVDGGGAGNPLLLQIQADVLGCPVRKPGALEMSAIGAAFLAGQSLGMWNGPEGMAAMQAPGTTTTEPSGQNGGMQAEYARWKAAVWAVLENARATSRAEGSPAPAVTR